MLLTGLILSVLLEIIFPYSPSTNLSLTVPVPVPASTVETTQDTNHVTSNEK